MIASYSPPTSPLVHAIEGRRATLRTDHRPLLFIFTQKAEKLIDRQARHVAFLSQFFHEIEHISGECNVVPDALSRLELATLEDGLPNLDQWAVDQANNAELQDIVSGNTESSLELEARQTTNGPVYFDRAHDRSRLFVPRCHRRAVFNTLHRQAHGDGAATCQVIKARFVWLRMDRVIRRWVKSYKHCQRAKVHRHRSHRLHPPIVDLGIFIWMSSAHCPCPTTPSIYSPASIASRVGLSTACVLTPLPPRW